MADGERCTVKYIFIILTVLVVIAYIVAALLTRCFGCTYAAVSPDFSSASNVSGS